jgi:hypothetical protein
VNANELSSLKKHVAGSQSPDNCFQVTDFNCLFQFWKLRNDSFPYEQTQKTQKSIAVHNEVEKD